MDRPNRSGGWVTAVIMDFPLLLKNDESSALLDTAEGDRHVDHTAMNVRLYGFSNRRLVATASSSLSEDGFKAKVPPQT